MLALVGFLATATYWPGISGAATTPRWSALFLLVPWLIRGDRVTDPMPYVWGGAFVLFAVASLFWTPQLLDGIGQVFTLSLLVALFWYGGEIGVGGLRMLFIGASIGVWISSGVAIVQALGYHPVDDLGPGWGPSGLFVNGNFLAETAALLCVAAIADRMWWLLPGLLPSLILPQGRGAMLAVAVAMACHCRGFARWTIIAAIGVGASIVAAHYMTDFGSLERLSIWRSVIHGLTFWGHGIGSFWTAYPAYDLREVVQTYPEHAHNEGLHIAFELGVPGVALAAGFCLSLTGYMNTARLVLIAFLVEACFAFPAHLPATAALGFIVAGYSVRTRHFLLSRLLYRRGVLLFGNDSDEWRSTDSGREIVSLRSSFSGRTDTLSGDEK